MKLISSYINALPKAEWIYQSGIPWLKLDINVPFQEIEEEWNNVSHLAVYHRDNDQIYNLKNFGWKSLTIYGVSSDITVESTGNHQWTEIAEMCPKTTEWIKNNFIINETTRRIRFMYLEPGGYILPHRDRDFSKLSEINVAISHPSKCYFKFKNYGIIPFSNGDAFIIDTSKEHAVHNQSNSARLHIILHTSISDELIEKSYGNSYHIKN